MGILIPFVAIALGSWLLSFHFRFRPQLAPLFCCCVITLAQYVFSLLGFIKSVPPVIVVIIVTLSGFRLWRLHNSMDLSAKAWLRSTNLLISVFCIVWMAVFLVNLRGVKVWHMDEFHIWASRVKQFALFGTYEPPGSFFFAFYPPASSLFNYFFVAFTGFKEWVMYVANMTLLFCCLLACCRFRRPLDLVFSSLFIITISALTYSFAALQFSVLQVDTLLAYLLGTSMYLAGTMRRGERDKVLVIFAALPVMVLCKQAGLVFATLVIGLLGFRAAVNLAYGLRGGHEKQLRISQLLRPRQFPFAMLALLAALVTFGTYGSWSRLKPTGDNIHVLSGKVLGVNDLGSLLLALKNPTTEQEKAVLPKYMEAVKGARPFFYLHGTSNPITSSVRALSKFSFGVIGITVMFTIFTCLLTYFMRKRKWSIEAPIIVYLAFLGGSAAYNLFYLFMYMQVFSIKEAVKLASYERYMASYYMAWVVSSLALFGGIAYRKHYVAYKTIRWVYAGLALFSVMATRELWSDFFLHNRYKTLTPVRDDFKAVRELSFNDVPASSGVYLIYSGVDSWEPMSAAHYELLPRRVNRDGWWPGPIHNYPSRVVLLPGGLAETVRRGSFSHLYVAKSNDEFWNIYSELFNVRKQQDHLLYRVEYNDQGEPRFTPTDIKRTGPYVTKDKFIFFAQDLGGAERYRADANGGIRMWSSGYLATDAVYIPFSARSAMFEMAATPALNVWPELSFTAINEKGKVEITPRFLANQREYVTYTIPLKEPLEPGKYQFLFGYLNNSAGVPKGHTEDRDVYVRRIVLSATLTTATQGI